MSNRYEVPISWHGPFSIVRQPGLEYVFDRKEIHKSGLYLWTVELADGYLNNYVGETGRTLRQRLGEDKKWSFDGNEGFVADPNEFRNGRIVTLARFNEQEFAADRDRLSSAIMDVYRIYRLFIAPGSFDKATRQYIEAGIIRMLRASTGVVADFLSNSRLIQPAPVPFVARFMGGHRFHGLDQVVPC